LVLVAGLAVTNYAWATPSAGFREVNGEVFDDWAIRRTDAFGEDGFYQLSKTSFRPVITYESLGEEADIAYSLGEQFAAEYPDRIQRAEAIFQFVRDRVIYTSDIDLFNYEEFAQNADELAAAIDKNGVGYGDCEDSTVLLAVMYKGAGLRSAITVGSGHTAALVYLPEYEKAMQVFKLGNEQGWLWCEATGKNNPLGWVPKEFIGVKVTAYEIGEEEIVPPEPSTPSEAAVTPEAAKPTASRIPYIPIFPIIWVLFWVIPRFRRRRRRAQ